jgi:ribosomal protein S18 acetylase RimI-like enzyme
MLRPPYIQGAQTVWGESLTDAYLAGIHEAGNPYFDFLFGDPASARQVLLSWIRRPASEVACERSFLLVIDGVLAGGYILLTADELNRCRTADLMALATGRGQIPRPILQQRLEAARGLFTAVKAGECYLSKFWVHPQVRGRRLAPELLDDVLHRARVTGSRDIRLDVHAGNARAIALYSRAGFTTGAHHTSPSGLEYISMIRSVAEPLSG